MAHLELPETALLGYEDIAITTEVKSLNASQFINPDNNLPAGAAFIQAQKASVRCRFDGGTPTSSSGIILAPGEAIQITGPAAMTGARFISDTRSALTLSVTYFA